MASAPHLPPCPGGFAAFPGDCFNFACHSSHSQLIPCKILYPLIGIICALTVLSCCYVGYCSDNSSPPETELRGDLAAPPAESLEEWVARRNVVCKYNRGDGVVMETECRVCMAEFGDGESLRLLPNCRHAFHVRCIDPWLGTHLHCPICRASMKIGPPPRPTPEKKDPTVEI